MPTDHRKGGTCPSPSRHVDVERGVPDWKPVHLERFQKWCSVEGRDKNTIDSQIEFIARDLCNSYENLCNSYETIGMALKLARTLEEAKAAVERYVSLLREESDWLEFVGVEFNPYADKFGGDGTPAFSLDLMVYRRT